jgi:hypothetical protein
MLIRVKEKEKPIDRRGSLAVLGHEALILQRKKWNPRPEFRVRLQYRAVKSLGS